MIQESYLFARTSRGTRTPDVIFLGAINSGLNGLWVDWIALCLNQPRGTPREAVHARRLSQRAVHGGLCVRTAAVRSLKGNASSRCFH